MLAQYEQFLATIPLDEYRKSLMPVKTVEQDLPRDLNPLPDIYRHYWVQSVPADGFPDYESFFADWWQGHLVPLDRFIRQYFWGCSYEFVRTGFKARLYRTLISVLTQFHFAYLWCEVCSFPLTTTADLDMKGVDAALTLPDGQSAALSVKKVTQRREAAGEGRFSLRQAKPWKHFIEVAYTIEPAEEIRDKVRRARQDNTRARYRLYYELATKLQCRLPNGFVVFSPDYPRGVEDLLRTLPAQEKLIPWDKTLRFCLERK